MKSVLKVITLCLASGAGTQTVLSYAEETANLPDLIKEQEQILTSLLSGEQESHSISDADNRAVIKSDDKKKLIIQNMVHYIRLIEGQEDLLDELQKQEFPELDINIILEGRRNPGI